MAKVPRTRNGATMTEAQYFSKIRSALRKAFSWWIPMQQALQRVKRSSQSSNKRLKFEYQCESCKDWFPRKEVCIDHVIPCGSLRSLEDIAIFIERLTQEDPKAYQILCTECHQNKTNSEAAARRVVKSN